MAGSQAGAPGSYTDDGPPERMIPLYSFRFAAPVSAGTTSEYTPSCRMRRAMRWVYWPPKSTTAIFSMGGKGSSACRFPAGACGMVGIARGRVCGGEGPCILMVRGGWRLRRGCAGTPCLDRITSRTKNFPGGDHEQTDS